jgi:hypothetical protein
VDCRTSFQVHGLCQTPPSSRHLMSNPANPIFNNLENIGTCRNNSVRYNNSHKRENVFHHDSHNSGYFLSLVEDYCM